jgi:hypothetical protein
LDRITQITKKSLSYIRSQHIYQDYLALTVKIKGSEKEDHFYFICAEITYQDEYKYLK